jgi:hypothetical protein
VQLGNEDDRREKIWDGRQDAEADKGTSTNVKVFVQSSVEEETTMIFNLWLAHIWFGWNFICTVIYQLKGSLKSGGGSGVA